MDLEQHIFNDFSIITNNLDGFIEHFDLGNKSECIHIQNLFLGIGGHIVFYCVVGTGDTLWKKIGASYFEEWKQALNKDDSNE